MSPEFPRFKSIQLLDRGFIRPRLWEYQPETKAKLSCHHERLVEKFRITLSQRSS